MDVIYIKVQLLHELGRYIKSSANAGQRCLFITAATTETFQARATNDHATHDKLNDAHNQLTNIMYIYVHTVVDK